MENIKWLKINAFHVFYKTNSGGGGVDLIFVHDIIIGEMVVAVGCFMEWSDKQKLAISLQNKNILVAASAGSGKTAVVIERVMEKVIDYKVDIDKILVLTFTNAAAHELKERLHKAFSKKLVAGGRVSFVKKQMKLLKRASITTLDSFCIELVKNNFNVLGIDPNFKICDNIKSEILKNKAMQSVLESKYENTNDLYKVLELFGGKEENLISTLLRVYTYIQSFPYPFKYLKNAIEMYNEDILDLSETNFGKIIMDDAIGNLNILLKRTENLREEIAGNDEFVRHVELLDDDILILKKCLNESNKWDTFQNELANSVFKKNLLVKVSNVELKDKIKDYRNNVLKKEFDKISGSMYENTQNIISDNKGAYEYLLYLYDFLLLFDKEFTKEKKKQNLLEFNDIHHLALELLYKDEKVTKVAKNLQEKYEEVYTDEYQDTDFVQEYILSAVSRENNRFMVGDIKQSIYKFRQARPEIFNKKYETYDNSENNVKIVLDENFRSRKNVIDSINYIFSRIMSKKMGECLYTDVETLKYGAKWYRNYESQDYSTEINIIDINNKKNKEQYEENQDDTIKEIIEMQKFEKEAMYIAKRISELKNNFKVFDSEKNEFRDARWNDIVILTRAIKGKGSILEKALKKFSIPAYCDTSTNLFLSDEIRQVIAFLRIIDNPLNDIDMLSIMYSVIGNFSLDELANIKLYKDNKKNSVYDSLIIYKNDIELSENMGLLQDDKLLAKIDNFLKLIDKFRNYSRIYNISDVLVKMYKETNIYTQYYLDKMCELKIANLNLLIDIARDYEKNNNYTLNSYISYIDNLMKLENSNGEAKIIGESEDVVRIMTINKSKGLEFPIVVLCDTTSEYNEKELSNVVVMHQDLGIGINVVNEDYGITYPSVIKQAIKNISKRELRSEALRVLYVAFTRAKEKLIVFSSLENYEKYNEKQFVIYNESAIEPMIVSQNNSYFANINMALKDLSSNEKIFEIRKIEANIEELALDVSSIQNESNENKFSIIEKIKLKENDEVLPLSNFKFKYEFENDVNSSSRVSVSELKEESIKDIEINKNSLFSKDTSEKYKLPSEFFDKPKHYTSLRKGTLIHFILQILDFNQIDSKESLKEYIEKMQVKNVINKEDTKYINVNKIYDFLNSKIGKDVKNAKIVKKEEEFVLKNTIYSNSTIQGVIDLYYVDDNDNAYLIDFKTDKSMDRNYYIEKYKLQLDIYANAIEKLTKYNVAKKYIYSFELEDVIEV